MLIITSWSIVGVKVHHSQPKISYYSDTKISHDSGWGQSPSGDGGPWEWGACTFVNSNNRLTELWHGLKKPGWRLKPNKAGGLKRNDFTFCSLGIILENRVTHSFALCIAGYIWLTVHLANVLSDVI